MAKRRRGGGRRRYYFRRPARRSRRARGLFGLPLPKAGTLIQGAYAANQIGAFDALDAIMKDPQNGLTNAYNTVLGRVTDVSNIVTTVIGGTVLNAFIRLTRRFGGPELRRWF